ncbi:MAG: DUF58 domain-containing protein [Verrucomicrobiales bacterium]|nr:DUF58 domain-containing protein [Verrucomicrobiales bacterium]
MSELQREPEGTPESLLDPQALAHAERLGLHARQVVEGYLAGEHRSPFFGFATEFAQHREYAQGDDLRHLDWKVLGRTDRYYVKQYEQETNFVAQILLDGSESMRYGSGAVTKLQYAKQLAACLSYLILLQRDAVAVGMFDAGLRRYLPRSNSRANLHVIMAQLASFEAGAKTQIGSVLHEMAQQTPRKGMVLLISDLFDDEDQILAGIQHLRFIGHEVIVLHVLDPAELEFPFSGNVEFVGLEGLPPQLTRAHEIRKSYRQEIDAFRNRLREGCERNQSHYVLVNTGDPLRETLSGYLAFRKKTGRTRRGGL